MVIGHSQFVHLSYGTIYLMKSNVVLVLIVLNQSLRHVKISCIIFLDSVYSRNLV